LQYHVKLQGKTIKELMTMRPACAYSSRASASLTAFLLPLYLKIDDDTTSTRPSASSVVLPYCCFTSALLKIGVDATSIRLCQQSVLIACGF